MKITPAIPGGRTAATQGTESASKKMIPTTTTSSTSLSADDITQAGLQSAQQTLNSENQDSDVDYDKVAQMQAALAAGNLQVTMMTLPLTC